MEITITLDSRGQKWRLRLEAHEAELLYHAIVKGVVLAAFEGQSQLPERHSNSMGVVMEVIKRMGQGELGCRTPRTLVMSNEAHFLCLAELLKRYNARNQELKDGMIGFLENIGDFALLGCLEPSDFEDLRLPSDADWLQEPPPSLETEDHVSGRDGLLGTDEIPSLDYMNPRTKSFCEKLRRFGRFFTAQA